MQCMVFSDDVCVLLRSWKLIMKMPTYKRSQVKKNKPLYYFNTIYHSAIMCLFSSQCFHLTHICFVFNFLSTSLDKQEIRILVLGAVQAEWGLHLVSFVETRATSESVINARLGQYTSFQKG